MTKINLLKLEFFAIASLLAIDVLPKVHAAFAMLQNALSACAQALVWVAK